MESMTHVRRAQSFARRRRYLTAAIIALVVASAIVVTAASGGERSAAVALALNGDTSCGYGGTTQFTESTVMRWAQVTGTGLGAQFEAFANDENSMLLGVNGATPNTSSPQHASPADGGATDQHDGVALTGSEKARPYYPALYITPVSGPGSWTKPGDAIPTAAGDWQQGGDPRNVSGGHPFVDDVFGTWVVGTQTINPSAAPGQVGTLASGPLSTTVNTTSLTLASPLTKTVYSGDSLVVATTGHTFTFKASAQANPGASAISVNGAKANFAYPNGSTVTDTTAQTGNYARQGSLPAKNDWNLGPFNTTGTTGPNADQPVGTTFTSMGTEGYGTEFRWNVNELTDNTGAALASGQWYKVQVVEHDGDQNKGGDSGEFCTLIKIPGPPALKTDPTGQTANVNANTVDATIKHKLGTSIQDAAFITPSPGFPNPTGSVTFHLWFYPVGTTIPANPCSGNEVTGFPDTNKALTVGNPSTATSKTYDTTSGGLGTYYWQAAYNHGTDPNYTDTTEACGNEVDQMVAAHIRLSPHEATNIVGNTHTLTATVESTTDGSSYSPVAGAQVTRSFVGSPSAQASFVAPAGTDCNGTTVKTDSNGQCTIRITDTTVETLTVNASSTFTVSGVIGTFTQTTSTAGNTCASGSECNDAIKHYIKPGTTLSVTDQLTGLGSDATGTVTYTVYDNSGCTTGNTDETPSPNNITAGNPAPVSLAVSVAPGHSVWFSAHYEGNEGTFTSDCTKETASSGTP
jgi:hypothetical protein